MNSYKKVYIEITNNCNLACDFCKATKRKKLFMGRELFVDIIDQAKSLAEEVVFHILGEPLLHPDLEYFIDHTLASGMTVMITTNGTLLHGSLAELLAKKKIRQINISMQVKDQLKNQQEYQERIDLFVDKVKSKNPEIYINLRFWNKQKIDPNWKSEHISGRVYLHKDTRFAWPNINGPVLQEKGFCYGLSSHFGVLVDGTVIPCCLDAEGDISLGNIKQLELKKILNIERAQKIRTGFQKRKMVEALCQRCGFAQRFAGKA